MPKSKRAKLISLTKTKSNVQEHKSKLIDNIRGAVDEYKYAVVFAFQNMRTSVFKDVRSDWADSRFFLGKNKVMRVALGRDEDEEYRDNLHKLALYLTGQVGLLFTNQPIEKVTKYFAELSAADYARTGCEATDTVTLKAGELQGVSHTMTEPLRKLGLPVDLQKGLVVLTRDHDVVKEGDVMTSEQARLLKHFDIKMAEFQIDPVAWWADGKFTEMPRDSDDDDEDDIDSN